MKLIIQKLFDHRKLDNQMQNLFIQTLNTDIQLPSCNNQVSKCKVNKPIAKQCISWDGGTI